MHRRQSKSQLDWTNRTPIISKEPIGIWAENPIDMICKTAVRKTAKWLPLSTDKLSIIGKDEVVDSGGIVDYESVLETGDSTVIEEPDYNKEAERKEVENKKKPQTEIKYTKKQEELINLAGGAGFDIDTMNSKLQETVHKNMEDLTDKEVEMVIKENFA